MSLKSTFESATITNEEKRKAKLQEFVTKSDEQITTAKAAIMKAVNEGKSEMKIVLDPIERPYKSIDHFDVFELLDSRLERAICAWLESEGFIVTGRWKECLYLHVKIYSDEYKILKLSNNSMSVKDIASKFEQNCNMME